MKLKKKQKELIDDLLKKVLEKYPELVFKGLQVAPNDPDHIWINVLADMNFEREIELLDFACEIESDIHIDYGYRISVMPDNPRLFV